MSSRSDEILLDRDRRDGGGVRYFHAATPGTLAAGSEAQGIGEDYWLREGGCEDPILALLQTWA